MINVFLTKIVMGFLAVALVVATGIFLFKIIGVIKRMLKFRLKFDDLLTILYIVMIITVCYYVGDWVG